MEGHRDRSSDGMALSAAIYRSRAMQGFSHSKGTATKDSHHRWSRNSTANPLLAMATASSQSLSVEAEEPPAAPIPSAVAAYATKLRHSVSGRWMQALQHREENRGTISAIDHTYEDSELEALPGLEAIPSDRSSFTSGSDFSLMRDPIPYDGLEAARGYGAMRRVCESFGSSLPLPSVELMPHPSSLQHLERRLPDDVTVTHHSLDDGSEVGSHDDTNAAATVLEVETYLRRANAAQPLSPLSLPPSADTNSSSRPRSIGSDPSGSRGLFVDTMNVGVAKPRKQRSPRHGISPRAARRRQKSAKAPGQGIATPPASPRRPRLCCCSSSTPSHWDPSPPPPVPSVDSPRRRPLQASRKSPTSRHGSSRRKLGQPRTLLETMTLRETKTSK